MDTLHRSVKAYERDPKLKSWIQTQIQCSDLGIRDVSIAEDSDGKRLVLFDHQGLDTPVLLQFESSGTKRLFHLLPHIFLALKLHRPSHSRRDRR